MGNIKIRGANKIFIVNIWENMNRARLISLLYISDC